MKTVFRALAVFVLCLPILASAQNVINNGGFEAGLAGWTVTNSGSGNFFAAGPGATPASGHSSVGPASGSLYAVSDQGGPGVHALSQDFTTGAGSTATLSFDMFVNDWDAGPFCGPGLDTSSGPVECGRVDILSAGSGAFSTGAGLLANYYLGADAAHGVANPYIHYSFDITGIVGGGGTFTLRFAEADNQLFFNQGVDNVSVDVTNTPEPGSIFLMGSGLLGLAGGIRRKLSR